MITYPIVTKTGYTCTFDKLNQKVPVDGITITVIFLANIKFNINYNSILKNTIRTNDLNAPIVSRLGFDGVWTNGSGNISPGSNLISITTPGEYDISWTANTTDISIKNAKEFFTSLTTSTNISLKDLTTIDTTTEVSLTDITKIVKFSNWTTTTTTFEKIY